MSFASDCDVHPAARRKRATTYVLSFSLCRSFSFISISSIRAVLPRRFIDAAVSKFSL